MIPYAYILYFGLKFDIWYEPEQHMETSHWFGTIDE